MHTPSRCRPILAAVLYVRDETNLEESVKETRRSIEGRDEEPAVRILVKDFECGDQTFQRLLRNKGIGFFDSDHFTIRDHS